MRRLVLLLALLLATLAPAGAQQLDDSVLRAIPIQNQGRLKPLDTFARESVFTITGKERFEGRAPVDTLLLWLSNPDGARKANVVDVTRQDVRQALELGDGRWVSVETLAGNARFTAVRKELMRKQQAGDDLSPLDKQMARLLNRVSLFDAIMTGEAWTIVPDPKDARNPWIPLSALNAGDSPLPAETSRALLGDMHAVVDAYTKHDNGAFVAASQKLQQALAAVGPGPDAASLQRELQYNDLHPFGKAWMLYVAAFLVLGAAGALKNQKLYWVGFAIAAGGFIIHLYGFYLRCVISGRAPVTNMYESVVYVSLGAMFFALCMEAVYRGRTLLMAATAVATVCLILADNTTSILDPTINPLTPVLRSNFWLTIHVLTITLSYAAFLLATGIAHVSLWNFGFHPENRARLRSLQQQMYKTMQIGVMLLAAGTILGGVWANYSWGRFWGWDPKEVWALIALLGYLAVLHGRYAGWLKDFGFAAGCIVAYCGVLMAWYGVNFVLGAGLHAYGFGDGGQAYVGMAVALDMAYVGLMWLLYNGKRSLRGQAAEDETPQPA